MALHLFQVQWKIFPCLATEEWACILYADNNDVVIGVVYNTIQIARDCIAALPKQALTYDVCFEIDFMETMFTYE